MQACSVHKLLHFVVRVLELAATQKELAETKVSLENSEQLSTLVDP